MAKTTKTNVTVVCNICEASQHTFEQMDLLGADEGERWDAITPMLAKIGWGIDRDDKDGRYAVCPGCAKTKEAWQSGEAFHPFTVHATCPKCGGRKIPYLWCPGLITDCPVKTKAEHMHRECDRCGYHWIEKTRDNSKKGHESWAKRTYLTIWRKCALLCGRNPNTSGTPSITSLPEPPKAP